MSKYSFEDYIKNKCHPTGYNEAVKQYVFGGSSDDLLLDKITDLETIIDSLRNGIIDDETLKELVKEHQLYKDLEAKLADAEKILKNESFCADVLHSNFELIKKENEKLKMKLEDSEDNHELLIRQFEEETENLRKQIKTESDARKRFVKEVKELKLQLKKKDEEITQRLVIQEKEYLEELAEKEKDKTDFSIEQLEEKKEKLYFELLFTRLQWIHKKADECREEKERFGGIEDMALDSVWRVLDLQKHECCEYEEMVELEEGIKTIAEDKLLRDIEHDLGVKVTRTENEIFNDIEIIDNQIKQLKEGK